MRLAISAGIVEEAAQGVTGQAVIRATLLASSDQLREALRNSPSHSLAVILDDQLYKDVVQTGRRGLRDATYDHVLIRDKHGDEHVAWITIPGSKRRGTTRAATGPAGPPAAGQPETRRRVHRRWQPRITVALIGACGAIAVAAITAPPGLFGGPSDPPVPGRGPSAVPSSRLADPAASPPPIGPGSTPLITVQLASSSTFFSDPNVEKELKRLGIVVEQAPIGSLQVCTEPKLINNFDISDSGSEEAASCVVSLARKAGKTPDKASPYEALMVIITYKPIVALLERLGVASKVNGITVFDVAKYLKVFASGERWTGIPGNTTYPNRNRILLWTTDPKESNSGGMLADIAYTAQTGGDTPTSIRPDDPHLPVIRSLLTHLGSLKDHTPNLLNQFLASGMGTYPMAMVYENDYLGAVLTGESHDPNLTVMYPTPDVLPQDTLVAWTPAGKKLIDVLQSPTMAAAEEVYGYRTAQDKAGFVRFMAGKGITVPDLDELPRTLQFTNLPPEDVLEELINVVATSQPN